MRPDISASSRFQITLLALLVNPVTDLALHQEQMPRTQVLRLFLSAADAHPCLPKTPLRRCCQNLPSCLSQFRQPTARQELALGRHISLLHKPVKKIQSHAHKSLPSLATHMRRHQILNQSCYWARSHHVLHKLKQSVGSRESICDIQGYSCLGGSCSATEATQARRSEEVRMPNFPFVCQTQIKTNNF